MNVEDLELTKDEERIFKERLKRLRKRRENELKARKKWQKILREEMRQKMANIESVFEPFKN